MTFQTWLLFLLMETALSLSPGPAVFYVVSQGVRAFPRAVPATLGILSANAVYFGLSATSLGALIATSARFFTVAKWVGAGYLIFLGIKALLFVLALLPQFIDTHRPVVPQMVVLAATSMLPECCILLAYGWLAYRAAHASARFGVTRSMNQWLAWVEGVGLLGCATLVLKFSRSD